MYRISSSHIALLFSASLLLTACGSDKPTESASAPARETATPEATAVTTPTPTERPAESEATATPALSVQDAATTPPAPVADTPPPTSATDPATTPAVAVATPTEEVRVAIAYREMYESLSQFNIEEAGPGTIAGKATDIKKQIDAFRSNLRPVDLKLAPFLAEASAALAELETLPPDSPRVPELVAKVQEAMRRADKE